MKSSKIEESLLSEKSFIVNDDLMSMAICQGHRNEFGAHLIQVLKQKCLIMLTLRSQRQNPKGHSPNAFLMQLRLKIRTLTTLSKMNAVIQASGLDSYLSVDVIFCIVVFVIVF